MKKCVCYLLTSFVIFVVTAQILSEIIFQLEMGNVAWEIGMRLVMTIWFLSWATPTIRDLLKD